MKKKKRMWKVPCVWMMMGYLTVEARSAEEAKELAKDMARDCALPTNGEYLEDSFEIDAEGEPFLVKTKGEKDA